MTATTQQRVELEAIGMVCRFSTNIVVALIVIGVVLGYVVSLESPRYLAWGWFAVLTATALTRWRYHSQFLSRRRDIDDILRWRILVIVGGTATGFAWSIPATWLLPHDVELQLFVCACLMGVVSAAVAVLAPLRHAFVWFTAPLLLPAAIAQFLQGGNQIYIGIGLLVFMGAMFGVGHRYHVSVTKMLMLVFENEELADRLAAENQRVAHANDRLQEQIDERIRVEESLQAAKVEADQANRAKSQFLANVSHEVRTPLNAIMGMTELLRRTELDAKQSKYTETTYRASERLLGIINDILDFARIEAGRLRLQIGPFEPRQWAAEVIELMSEQTAAKQLTLTYSVAPDVPQRIQGDAARLRQVLTNLVSNAVKFTQMGGVNIALRVDRGMQDKPTLRCEVSDTGIGISADAQDKLFQPFSQVDDSTSRRFGGAGLGLAISKELIEAMQGELGVESRSGSGSTFWFCIPLDAIEPQQSLDAPLNARSTPELSARILVAEDTDLSRELIVDMLTLAGCKVCAVESGKKALQRLDEESFDVVLMDWHMPELDGLTAIRLLREKAPASQRRIPIIALTASAMPGDRETCLAAGADDYLSKPFTYEALLAIVSKYAGASNAN